MRIGLGRCQKIIQSGISKTPILTKKRDINPGRDASWVDRQLPEPSLLRRHHHGAPPF